MLEKHCRILDAIWRIAGLSLSLPMEWAGRLGLGIVKDPRFGLAFVELRIHRTCSFDSLFKRQKKAFLGNASLSMDLRLQMPVEAY